MITRYNKYLILFLAVFLSNCATRSEIVRFKVDTSYIMDQLDSLQVDAQRRDQETKAQIAALENLIKQQGAVMLKMKANLETRMSNLDERLHVLGGKVEDSTYRLSEVTQKVEELKMIGTDTTGTVKNMLQVGLLGTTKVASQPLKVAKSDPDALYKVAYSDFIKGNYDLAIVEFEDFIKTYPKTILAGNAQFWIGQAYYAQGKYDKAIVEYQKVIDRYPKGEKVPSVLLKIGYCWDEMGDPVRAKEYLKRLVKQYPSSREVPKAKEKLEALSNK